MDTQEVRKFALEVVIQQGFQGLDGLIAEANKIAAYVEGSNNSIVDLWDKGRLTGASDYACAGVPRKS